MHNRFPIEIGIILFPLLAAGQSRAAAPHLSSDVFPMETAPVALMKQYNTNMEHSVPECGFEVLKTYQAPSHIWDLPR